MYRFHLLFTTPAATQRKTSKCFGTRNKPLHITQFAYATLRFIAVVSLCRQYRPNSATLRNIRLYHQLAKAFTHEHRPA